MISLDSLNNICCVGPFAAGAVASQRALDPTVEDRMSQLQHIFYFLGVYLSFKQHLASICSISLVTSFLAWALEVKVDTSKNFVVIHRQLPIVVKELLGNITLVIFIL